MRVTIRNNDFVVDVQNIPDPMAWTCLVVLGVCVIAIVAWRLWSSGT